MSKENRRENRKGFPVEYPFLIQIEEMRIQGIEQRVELIKTIIMEKISDNPEIQTIKIMNKKFANNNLPVDKPTAEKIMKELIELGLNVELEESRYDLNTIFINLVINLATKKDN